MNKLLLLFLFLINLTLLAQVPFYDFSAVKFQNQMPKGLNSERAVVIVNSIPPEQHDFDNITRQINTPLSMMYIDAVMYLEQSDILANATTKDFYAQKIQSREIKHLIFVNCTSENYEIIITPMSGDNFFVPSGASATRITDTTLNASMLQLARKIKQAELPKSNFLIPKTPIISHPMVLTEEANPRYPTQLRRRKLAVEKFSPLVLRENANATEKEKVDTYNLLIKQKNETLENIMKTYPYEYELVPNYTNKQLVERRFQYVLRHLHASVKTMRNMLGHPPEKNRTIESQLSSDDTKTLNQRSVAYKFYLVNTVAEATHVGKWDADTEWEQALKHFIGNLSNALAE